MEQPSRDALVAVYPDERTAALVADEVRGRATSAVVRVNDPHDRVDALRAEMREELEHTFFSPQVGVAYPKESTKSLAVTMPIGAAVGAVLAVPLAFVFQDSELGLRLLWAVIIGAVMGATVVWIAASAMAIGGPAKQLAGHRGVPVRVEGDLDPDVVGVLAEHEPLRIDLVTNEGRPIATLMTEEELSPEGIFERLHGKLTQDPHGDWSVMQTDELTDLQARNREIQHAANDGTDPWRQGEMTDPRQTSEKDR